MRVRHWRFAARSGLAVAAMCAGVILLGTTSDARPRKRAASKPDIVVVHPRSFTNSGVVVPVGSMNAYVQQMTRYNRQPLQQYSPGILWGPGSHLLP